jgi:site-specific recombinase XerC
MIERAVTSARLRIRARAHMLRHACGYKLANDGVDTRSLQAYLGHCNIENTTRYTALAPDRFKGFLERLMEAFTARALEKTRSARRALRPRNVANARNRQGGEPYSRFLSTLGL